MNASLTEYLRDLADWIHHEAFHKLPDELEEKADEVRELAQTLESGVVVVPVEVAREYVESHRVPPTPNATENQRRIERAIAATQRLDEHLAAALSRLQQHGGWWETGDQEPRRLREDCYEPGQQMGGGQGA